MALFEEDARTLVGDAEVGHFLAQGLFFEHGVVEGRKAFECLLLFSVGLRKG